MIDTRLRALWADALDLSGEWSPEATFFELGGYSLLALSIADRLRAEFGVDAPRTVVFDNPTFSSLADWLRSTATRVSTMDSTVAEERTLSPLQQAYVLGETGAFELASPALFVEDYACRDLDVPALRAAVRTLMERHEMLRARFRSDGTYQIAEVPTAAPVAVRDLTAWPAGRIDAELARVRAELVASPPALDAGTAWEFRVFRVPGAVSTNVHRVSRRPSFPLAALPIRPSTVQYEDEPAPCQRKPGSADRPTNVSGHRTSEWRVLVCGRLLVFDGRSGEIVADELRALLAGHVPPPTGYRFGEYRAAVAELRAGPEYADARAYWAPRIAALPPPPDLPRVAGEPGLRRRTLTLDEPRWAAFKANAGASGVTPTAALCAAFAEVLRHFSAEADFTLNVMYGERRATHPAVGDVVGNFSDTLLLECQAAPKDTFAERAAALGTLLVAALAHGSFSGVEAIRELNQRHGNTRGAAMPVVFASVVGGRTQDGIFLERLGWTRVSGEIHTPQVCFDHQVFDTRGTLVANWDTADGLFPSGLVDAMFDGYRALLEALSTDPSAWRLSAFPLTPRAQSSVRERVNATAADLPVTTLHGPVFAQAMRTPDAVAVLAADRTLTYRELTALAGGVAARLAAAGCVPGEPVLVRQDRGWRQVVALLGVLAAGAAYVPVGHDWPDARVAAVRKRVAARYVVGEPAGEATRITVAGPGERPDVPQRPDSLAYVLFTSGTTGEPKGVAVRHSAAANTVADINRRFRLGPADRVLGISEVTFDLSVFDVFGPLAVGGAVVPVARDAADDPAALHALAAAHAVTVWNSVPAYLGMLLDYRAAGRREDLPALRLALVSGDWVPVTLGGRLATEVPAVELISLGGATEAAIWSNYHPVTATPLPGWSTVPYGLPLANQWFRVLDDALGDRPDWVPGDLYIGGAGLADGYYGDQELTAAAFVDRDGERLYRTGDRGRYRPDGVLEFLGRRDNQVKVNGFRVELGEIDAALLAQPGVRAASAVLAADDRGGALVAHIVADAGDDRIQAGLRERLPSYLVPRTLVRHRALPLTANGKVDRARLKSAPAAARPERVPPSSPAEERLLLLWRGLVDVHGVTDDFFAAGGHSLMAAALMNAIEGEFGVRLALSTLYTHRTVRELAPLLADRMPAGPSLVHLGGDGDPLVFVHPVGGDVFCYAHLATELAGFRTYGIAADPAPSGERAMPELAAEYLGLAGTVAADARLRLVGWSFGAVLVYEMARAALRDGRDCTAVLLDPWLPRDPGATVPAAVLRTSFAHNLSQGRVADPARVPGLTEATVAALYGRYLANMRALLGHRFRPEPGLRPTLVTAEQGLGEGGSEFLVPFPADAAGARRHTIRGDHFAVVDPGRSAEVAALIGHGMR